MSASTRTKPFRVLVVDPDDTACVLLNARLGGDDFDVMCAASDAAAYAALGAEAPTLDALVVATDLGPGTTGFDVARQARRLNDQIPVIFLSHAPRASAERFGVPGAAYLSTPFDPELLVMVLRELASEG